MKTSFRNKLTRSSTVKMASIAIASVGMLSACGLPATNAKVEAPEKADTNLQKPNFITIVADDLGFSDLSCFGGEIDTPNICALAQNGVMATDYYTSPLSAPTRAMLRTGVDLHKTGLGNLPPLRSANQMGMPGYEGHLNHRVMTTAEILKQAGYSTYFSGKWHIGHSSGTYATDRGFDHGFGYTGGGVSHWGDQLPLTPFLELTSFYVEDGKKVEKLPSDFYSSKNYTDKIIEYIDTNPHKPFFAELSFTAPHNPLQAPDEWIEKYMGRYDAGYDVLRKERLQRLKDMGLIAQDIQEVANNPDFQPWTSLTPEEQKRSAKSMAIYAAMVSYMDDQVGRLIQHLKDTGEYDNTYIFFMSDNGANSKPSQFYPGNSPKFMAQFDNSYENMGRHNSYISYDAGWAQAGTTPYAFYKATTGEGGVRAPMIVAGPNIAHKGQYVTTGGALITDITPTILDLAGVKQPARFHDIEVEPIMGTSWKPFLSGTAQTVRGDGDSIALELNGYKMYIKDNWKIRQLSGPHRKVAGGKWELFNLAEDPSEQNNLATKYPEKVQELVALYEAYAKEVGIVDRKGKYPTTFHRQTWSIRQGMFSENPYENIYHKQQ